IVAHDACASAFAQKARNAPQTRALRGPRSDDCFRERHVKSFLAGQRLAKVSFSSLLRNIANAAPSPQRASIASSGLVERVIGRHSSVPTTPDERHARTFSTNVAICTNSTLGRTP